MVHLNADFKVDNFHARFPNQYTFFLSHNHEDHLKGLTNGEGHHRGASNMPRMDWNYGKIYCS